jgi:hypothetical protein
MERLFEPNIGEERQLTLEMKTAGGDVEQIGSEQLLLGLAPKQHRIKGTIT